MGILDSRKHRVLMGLAIWSAGGLILTQLQEVLDPQVFGLAFVFWTVLMLRTTWTLGWKEQPVQQEAVAADQEEEEEEEPSRGGARRRRVRRD